LKGRRKTTVVAAAGVAALLLCACPGTRGTRTPLRQESPPAGARPAAAPAAAPAATVEERPVQLERFGPVSRARLPNGLTVLLRPRPGSRLVAVQAWVDVGSADERPDEWGAAHLLEHMLFKGTGQRAVGQLAAEVEGAGGDINAWTSFDHTVYHLVLPAERLDTGLEVLADALANSAIDAGELERERQVVLEEIRRNRDQPASWAGDLLFATAFRSHPYRRAILGSAASLKRLERRRLVDFYRRHYRPEAITLVVVGDVAEEKVLARVRRLFFPGVRAGRAPARTRPPEPRQRKPRLLVKRQDVQEAHFQLGWPVPGATHADTPGLDLLAALLGQGESSRLVSRLKRGRNLVNDVYAYAYNPLDPGLLVVGGTCPAARLEQALQALAAEIYRLRRQRVSAAELLKVQSLLEGESLYQLETVEGEARRLGAFQTVSGDPTWGDKYLQRLLATNPAAIERLARTYLVPEKLSAVLVLPAGSRIADDRLRRALAAGRQQEPEAPPLRLVRRRLRQGPLVLVERVPDSGLVAIRAALLGGVRLENERNNGIHNLIAALLTRGTRRLGAAELASEVDRLAGTLEGFSGRNSIGLRADFPARHFERALQLTCQCLVEPSFPADQVKRERKLVLEQIRARQDDLAGLAFDLFAATLYRRHPYRLSPLGTRQSLLGLDHERLAAYWKRFFHPRRLVVAVSGDVDAGRVQELVGRWCRVKRRDDFRPPRLPLEPAPTRERRLVRYRDRQQAHLVLGFLGTRLGASDRYALDVLMAVLTGQSGRLFLELRDRLSLAYALSGFSLEGVEPGYLAFYLATDPRRLEEARDALRRQLREIAGAGASAGEVERAKRYLAGSQLVARQRTSTRALEMLFGELYGTGQQWRDYPERIMAVTPEQVRRAARRYLRLQAAVEVVVRPPAGEGRPGSNLP